MRKLAPLLLLAAALPARATSCLGPITVCVSYAANSIVFRGRVVQTAIPPSPGTPVTYPDGTNTTLYTVSMSEQVRFTILEVFKDDAGALKTTREVTLTASQGEFHADREYIVFASPNPSTHALGTSVCSGNRALSNPDTAADLAWLRAYPTAPPTVRIFGQVNMGYGVTDIPPITLNLADPKTLTAASTPDHTYSFPDLPPGTYTVTAVLPAGYTPFAEDTATVTVAPKSCAEVDWAIRHDTHIRGAVTDPSGNPAPNVPVGLLRPSQSRTGYDIVTSHRTDANGHYDFSKADPGNYWIAIHYHGPDNNDPYAPVYYPAATSQSSAQLIHLGPTDSRDDVNLVLAPPLNPVTLQVHVLNPDGSPVIKAHVIANDPLTPTQFIGATADDHGDADINLYEGREYRLVANTAGNREPACAGPIAFTAHQGLQLPTLTLDKTFNQCRTLQHAR